MLDAELLYGLLSHILCNCMVARFFWVCGLLISFVSHFFLIALFRPSAKKFVRGINLSCFETRKCLRAVLPVAVGWGSSFGVA